MTRRRVGLSALALLVVVLAGLAWWSLRREQSGALPASAPRGAAVAPALLPDAGSDPGDASTLRFAAGEQQPLAPVQAEPSAGGELTGSLTVHVRWQEDGTPAAGIGLRLILLDEPDPLYHAIEGISDGRGVWSAMGLAPGRVLVNSDRVEAQAGVIVAGRDTQLTLELLPGLLVRGHVVDSDGQNVPDAVVWLDGHNSVGDIRPVGRADNRGNFAVPHIRSGQSVGASAPGHTRSAAYRIRDYHDGLLAFTLELGPAGGALHGLVVAPDGRPIAGATVLVTAEGAWPLPPHRRAHLVRPPPLRLVTDDRGEFLAEDVPVGRVEVAARATGWSPWGGSTDVKIGQTAEVRAALQPSASLTGVVRDTEGQPFADVHVGTEGVPEMSLQYDFSAPDGRFTLRDLPLGRITFAAYKDGSGRAETMLMIEAGGRYTWDPEIARDAGSSQGR